MLARMHDLVNNGSQFIIATHSLILMTYPGATIYELGADGMTEAFYERLEQVQLYKYFLNNPEGMMESILNRNTLEN